MTQKDKQPFSLIKRIKSFGFAFHGLMILFKEEHNTRIHLIATVCVVIAGITFKVSALEWIALVLAIGLVLSLEILNSAIENMADFISLQKHDAIKKIKDLAAAAVLIAAAAALVVGLIVFIPKVLALF